MRISKHVHALSRWCVHGHARSCAIIHESMRDHARAYAQSCMTLCAVKVRPWTAAHGGRRSRGISKRHLPSRAFKLTIGALWPSQPRRFQIFFPSSARPINQVRSMWTGRIECTKELIHANKSNRICVVWKFIISLAKANHEIITIFTRQDR